MNRKISTCSLLLGAAALSFAVIAKPIKVDGLVLKAGSPTLKAWILPKTPPAPADNQPNAARIKLGKALFFDPRLSLKGNMSCASCHNPSLGWSDALPKGRGHDGKLLGRTSPTVINTAFNTIHMWDGRKATLEDQALGPMESKDEMHTDFNYVVPMLKRIPGYRKMFAAAYPGEPIGKPTIGKAIASFERTVIQTNTPFDKWLHGDKHAMTASQVRGFAIFLDPKKGNCAVCHSAPNFTDNGFHNIGLKSFGDKNPDVGRFAQKPIRLMKGAFATSTLRDISLTAPYFHDGSAKTLMDVVEHYNRGGDVKTNLSPNLKKLNLSRKEMVDLVNFMNALTGPQMHVTLPILPQEPQTAGGK